jgi:RNA polymerase sigma-B factor
VNAYVAEYSRQHGRSPSTAEIAAALGVQEKLLVEMLASLATAENLLSLDAQLSCADSTSTYMEMIPDEKSLEDPLEALDREMAIEALRDAIDELPKGQREVVEAQMSDQSMVSLAKEIGVHRSVISIRAEGAHRALRSRMCGTPAPAKPAPSAYPHLCVKQLSQQLQELDLLAVA